MATTGIYCGYDAYIYIRGIYIYKLLDNYLLVLWKQTCGHLARIYHWSSIAISPLSLKSQFWLLHLTIEHCPYHISCQIEFKKKFLHADVPAEYPSGQTLGQWVKEQRDIYESGTLAEDGLDRSTAPIGRPQTRVADSLCLLRLGVNSISVQGFRQRVQRSVVVRGVVSREVCGVNC